MRKFLKALVSSLCLLALSLAPLGVPHVQAASSLSALRVTTTGNGAITMTPGEFKTITVTFQNSGTSTWKNDGTGYVSLYTYGPKYRVSAFDPGNWLSAKQVKRIKEASVAQNGTATINFDINAPQNEGTYNETFALASEEKAWIPGGEFTLNITVKKPSPSSSTSSSTSQALPTSSTSTAPSAVLVSQSAASVEVKAKKTVPVGVVFKNTGTTTWTSVGLKDASVTMASTKTISFANSTWQGSQAVVLTGQSVKPGKTVEMQFLLSAPSVNGTHNAKLQLVANGTESGVFVELPVTVTGGSGELLNAPVVTTEPPVDTKTYIDEPTMRVGVLIVDEETNNEVKIGSDESDVEVRDTNNTLLTTIAKGKDLRAAYENGVYAYGSGKSSTLPLRFAATTPNAVLKITNFDRRITRGTSSANNTFRNVLELRYNTKKDRTWIINELPMEYYLRGLAETSNSSPIEYQKAILTAARTYAYYHVTHASKHAAEGYHVDAYQDQVYWGYGQEEKTPNITAAVEATRGQIVTYNGETAITSYFSRSNGMTKNWSDVWGGNVPYAKAVPVPCDVGKTLWGHGVGMSASGAICMANEGKLFNEILTYFYTGVAIDQKWK